MAMTRIQREPTVASTILALAPTGGPGFRSFFRRRLLAGAIAAAFGLIISPPAQATTYTWTGAPGATWDTTDMNWNPAGATWANPAGFSHVAQLGSGTPVLGAEVRMASFTGDASSSITAGAGNSVRISSGTSTFAGTIGQNVRVVWDGAATLDFSGNNNDTANGWVFRNGGTFRISSANAWKTTSNSKVEASSTTFTFELAAADLSINTGNMFLNNSGTAGLRFAALNADRTVTWTGGTPGGAATAINWASTAGIGETLAFGNDNATHKLIWASGIDLNGGSGATLTRTINVTNGTAAVGGEISGVISDSGTTKATLLKTGTGTLILSGSNTYAGATTGSAGVLLATKTAALPGYNVAGKVIFNGGTIGVVMGTSPTNWSTAEVDTLLTNATKTSGALGIDTTNGNRIQWTPFTTTNFGGLGLSKLGPNDLTLNQANTYTGATAISAGTVTVSGSGTLGNGSALTMAGGGLNLGTTTQTVGAVSVTAPAGSGDTISNGSLTGTSYAAGNTTGNAVISANLLVNGAAGFTKTGAGTVTLSGANTYTGATAVSAGTLVFAPASGSSTLSGAITGSGAIVKSGNGTTVINAATGGANTFNGTVVVDGGILQFGSGTANQSRGLNSAASYTVNSGGIIETARDAMNQTPVFLNGGTLRISAGGGYQTVGALTLNGGTLQSGPGLGDVYQGFALSGNVTVGGTSASSIQTAGGANSGVHLAFNASAGTARTFDVADATAGIDLTVSAPLLNSSHNGNSAGLTKSGAGTMALSGANTYSGDTTVSNGTLLVSGGGITGSVVTVVSGASFGAAGTNVARVAGLTLNPGAKVVWTYDGAARAAGRVAVLGTLDLPVSATLDVSRTGFLDSNQTLFSATALTGATDLSGWTITGAPNNSRVVVDGTQVKLVVNHGTVITIR
jgi:autotransporter-associated beta strand protein